MVIGNNLFSQGMVMHWHTLPMWGHHPWRFRSCGTWHVEVGWVGCGGREVFVSLNDSMKTQRGELADG